MLKLLEVYNMENEFYQVGSCDYFFKEVYYSESEGIEVKYNEDSSAGWLAFPFLVADVNNSVIFILNKFCSSTPILWFYFELL